MPGFPRKFFSASDISCHAYLPPCGRDSYGRLVLKLKVLGHGHVFEVWISISSGSDIITPGVLPMERPPFKELSSTIEQNVPRRLPGRGPRSAAQPSTP